MCVFLPRFRLRSREVDEIAMILSKWDEANTGGLVETLHTIEDDAAFVLSYREI